MVRPKVRLTGHAADDPPVIQGPSGHEVLERISTSFSYRSEAYPEPGGPATIFMG